MDRSALPAILRSLWRHRYATAIVTLAVAGLVFGISRSRPEVYASQARVFFVDPRGGGILSNTGQPRIDSEAFVNQQVQQALSRPVIEQAAELIGDDQPAPDELGDAVVVDGQPDLLAMQITATAGSPEQAAAYANAVADAFEVVVRDRGLADAERAVAELAQEVAGIQEQIDDLAQQLSANPDQPVLDARLQSLVQVQLDLEARQRELTVEAVATGAGIDVVDPATRPESAASPKPLRDAIAFGALALLISGGIAHWHASRARKVEHRLDPERILDVPLLAEVPRFDSDAVSEGRLDPAVQESLQFVLSSLDYVIGDAEAMSIAVTSATPGEGKTSLSLLLGLTIGKENRPVIVVDADLRARGLTRRLRSEGRRGLTDFVDLGVTMDRCVHRTSIPSFEPIAIMPAGRREEAPTGLLRSKAFGRRLDELAESFGIALLDTPPLLAVADAAVVCSRADAVVIVVDHGIRMTDLHRLRERLAVVRRPILGYIYNRAPLRGSHYGYGYGAQASPEQSGDGARTGRWSRRVSSSPEGHAVRGRSADDEQALVQRHDG